MRHIYFNARYYDPEVGRFLTEDPSRKGTSWYSYCNNNPLRFNDPTGLRGIAEEYNLSGIPYWQYEYEAYRESVVGQIQPRNPEQEEEFYQGVERGIDKVSNPEFEELKQS